MILFEKDWADWPTARPHYATKQTSWKRQAAVYKSMGIRNHAFILALVDPRLEHVDPHSPDLTDEQIGWIAAECKANPWYFFRECLRVPAQSGAEARPFLANRGNIALFWNFFNHVMFILIQPRQTGKSISTDGLMIYLLNVACKNTTINLLTKDEKLRRENVGRLKEMREELPFFLRHKNAGDANNTELITVNALGNKYLTHIGQPTERGANNMARGFTSPIFQFDEPPFQPNLHLALGPALAAGSAARSLADAAGSPWGTIFTTTAGKKDEPEGEYFYTKVLQRAAMWDERYFDCKNREDLWTAIRKAMINREGRRGVSGSESPMTSAVLSHRQLGYTDEWLAQKLSEAMQEGQNADRDFFNQWTSGTQRSPFTPEILELIESGVKESPEHLEITPQLYTLRWYVPEGRIPHELDDWHILNFDPSEASGRDDIGVTMINSRTLGLTMASVINETNLIEFMQWTGQFMMTHPKTIAVIERRSMGSALCDYLIQFFLSRGEDPFKRIFNRVVNDADDRPERFEEINTPMRYRDPRVYVQHKATFGWATSSGGITNRKELYGTTMQMVIKRAADRIHDPTIIKQLKGLTIIKERVDHQRGEHDDMVISWLLGHWFLIHGRNLSWYGLDINRVGSDSYRERIDNKSAEERYFENEQRILREEFANLVEEIKYQSDQYLRVKLEQRLRMIEQRIVEEEGEMFSVDEALRSLKDAKRDRSRERFEAYDRRTRFAEQRYSHHGDPHAFVREYDEVGW